MIEAFAEIGVVFLLFAIGLEFSLEALGRPPSLALFYGFLAALSSTAILIKLYAFDLLERPREGTAR